VPPTVTIASGQANTSFSFTTGKTVSGWVILTATLGAASKTAVITISSGSVSTTTRLAISCDQVSLVGGGNDKCQITLDPPSTSDSTEVQVTSSNAKLKVPAIVGARVGQGRLEFEVAADAKASVETAVLEARIGSTAAQASIAMEPASAPQITAPVEVSGKPGSPVQFAVTASEGDMVASGLPRGATFAAGAFEWTPAENDLGVYQIQFAATASSGTVTKTLTLTVDSGSPVIARLENGAGKSATSGCSSGSVATLRGRWLTEGALPVSDWAGASTELGGTRVAVNGEYVAVLYASADRVDLQCPSAAAGTQLSIAVETASGRSNEIGSIVEANAPGLYTVDGSGEAQALAVRSGSSDLAAIPNDRTSGKPAMAGDSITFAATGIDCTAGSETGLTVQIGMDVVAVKAVAPLTGHAGLCAVEMVVPPSAIGDAVPVRLHVPGADSNPVSISVVDRPRP
jgi:uncharacterized protein (TIGR03437 family)